MNGLRTNRQGSMSQETNYFREAQVFDGARSKKYWSTPCELGARAFAAFVEDQLRKMGGRCDYLCHSTWRSTEFPDAEKMYPQDQERETANGHFLQLAGWSVTLNILQAK